MWRVSVVLQPMRGSPLRGLSYLPVWCPVCVAFMIVIPSVPPPEVTDCQMALLVGKLGRGDTPAYGRSVTGE
ncbi:hypothetical protein Sdagh_54620 [Streptomyces daghestanicus]|uniref:Secreted protein n=1 Tax=Streptomyces daghestanicus TaxID=66885 RepID=A0ABQ3Q915_9ACTN|nr:hypothetical protein Sdagh_54620 [Streptomyces daghestanicus]